MKSSQIVLLSGILFLAMGGCASLELTTSQPVDQANDKNSFYFDSESELMYAVSNDLDSLHLKLRTTNRSTMNRMLRQGTVIYFDLSARKKQDIYVQYPLITRPLVKEGGPGGMDRGSMGMEVASGGMENIPEDILFVNRGVEEFLQPSPFVSPDIKASLEMEDERTLCYELSIPFYRICNEGIEGIEKLSIGILMETKNSKGDSGENSRESPGGMGGSGGGGPGGRPGGGPGGMGGGPGGMGGGPGGMNQGGPSGGSSDINIWFEVELNR